MKIRTGILIAVIIALFAGCAPTTTQTTETHININGEIVVGGDGEPIELIDNPNATNPTYAELLSFLNRDQTDKYSYIAGPPKNAFVCSDFAETVHNNAEAAGIRAAWVGISFEGTTEGHAINAFETTDLGLVYVDCTGKGLWDESSYRSSYDRRVRVEIGEPYLAANIADAKTQFKFLISEPINADLKYTLGDPQLSPFVSDEQLLRSLEELGWIGPKLSSQNYNKMLEWSRIHNIEEIGLKWVQEWIQEHQVELGGRDFELHEYGVNHDGRGGSDSWVAEAVWYILVDCVDTSWFQPVEKLVDVDGIPLVWRIVWEIPKTSWYEPFGDTVIEHIHIFWGE